MAAHETSVQQLKEALAAQEARAMAAERLAEELLQARRDAGQLRTPVLGQTQAAPATQAESPKGSLSSSSSEADNFALQDCEAYRVAAEPMVWSSAHSTPRIRNLVDFEGAVP